MSTDLRVAYPPSALSVRQPWAWAIIHAGKDIENRGWALRGRHPSPNAIAARTVGRIAIHAASGMTRDEYADAADFMHRLGISVPAPHELVRGAVIGSVEVVDVVEASTSKWFFGPTGLVLQSPVAGDPVACRGQLGFFQWEAGRCDRMAEPAKWMLPTSKPSIAGQRNDSAEQRTLL